MNEHDPFEQRLRRQPLRQIPAAWREEILSQARAAAGGNRRTAPVRGLPFVAAVQLRLRELLWPCPQAWAGLAAVWVVILAANFATPEPTPTLEARRVTPPSPQMRQILKEQKQMLAELGEVAEPRGAEPPGRMAPQPRSQRREQLMNT